MKNSKKSKTDKAQTLAKIEREKRKNEAWQLWRRGASISKIADQMKLDYNTVAAYVFDIANELGKEELQMTARQAIATIISDTKERLLRLWNKYSELNDKKVTEMTDAQRYKLQLDYLERIAAEEDKFVKAMQFAGILPKDVPQTIINAETAAVDNRSIIITADERKALVERLILQAKTNKG